MRLFVALDLSEPQRVEAARAADVLQRALASARAPRAVRWASADQLHVTIRFIGEVSDADGARIVEAIAPPLGVAPFTMALGALGVFPGPGRPRVIWLGLSQGGAGAADVHSGIEKRLGALGLAPEARPFRAHVTIGRVREIRPAQASALAAAMKRLRVEPVPADVAGATLYRSHLSPKGARYEPLARAPLTG